MDEKTLLEARTNPDFLKYLEEARENAIKEKDISLMYETLDSMLILDLDEEKINKLYEEILKTSFDNVEELMNKNKKLKLQGDNLYYIRALYEYAVEKWSNDNFKGAKELIFILANIVDDEKLIKSLKILIVFISQKMNLDEFYDKQVDLKRISDDKVYGYFILNFNFDDDEFLSKNRSLLEDEYKKLKYLLEK